MGVCGTRGRIEFTRLCILQQGLIDQLRRLSDAGIEFALLCPNGLHKFLGLGSDDFGRREQSVVGIAV